MVKIPLSLLLISYNAMNYRLVEKKVPLSLSCCIEKGIEIFFAFENPWQLENDLIEEERTVCILGVLKNG